MKCDDFSLLNEASPPTFSYLQKLRLSGRVGGVAVIYNVNYICTPVSFGEFSSFEYLAFCLNKRQPTLFILVYRHPKPNGSFITEFSDLISLVMPKNDGVIVLGDFNIHLCCPNNVMAGEFLNLTESFDFVFHASGPTHNQGHTLDLVLSSGVSIVNFETTDVCF